MPGDRPIRTLLRAGLLALAMPWLLATGLGWPSRAGGTLDGLIQRAMFFCSDPVPFAQVALSGPLRAAAALAGTALLLLAARAWEKRTPWAVAWLPALPEAGIACMGMLAGAGLFAVGCGLDRPLFWGGFVAALLVGRRGGQPGRGMRWRDPRNVPWRLAVLALAAGLTLLAGRTLLEGPGQRSPALRLGGLWLDGPGRSGWTSGGAWLALGLLGAGLAAVAERRRRRGLALGAPGWRERLRPAPWPGRAAAAVVAAVVCAHEALALPWGADRLAALLSAPGLLLLAASAWPALARRIPDTRARFDALDPRRLLSSLVPLLLWAALCAARGLTCSMWTAPGPLPPGVEQISEAAGVFSVAIDPGTGDVVFSDRDRRELGVVGADGAVRSLPVTGRWNPEEVEPAGGRLLVSLVGRDDSGIVEADVQRGPRWPGIAIPGQCWISGIWPIPGQAAMATGVPIGTILAGCEQGRQVWLLGPDLAPLRVLPVPREVEEAAFSRDGRSLYVVGLWSGSRVLRLSWPDLAPQASRTVGAFNWTLVVDEDRDLVWLTRFFEGRLLGLDATTLEERRTIPLSFGLRAMAHDPVRDRLWVAAAYSGLLWSLDPDEPDRRRSYALCGQARDVAVDARGRAIVGTDCGVFRIDEARGATGPGAGRAPARTPGRAGP